DLQGDRAAGRGGPAAGVLEHPRGQVDAGERDVGGVAVEAQARADAHLEHVPGGAAARPPPAVAEQLAVEERHLPVVGVRVAVPEAAQALDVGHSHPPVLPGATTAPAADGTPGGPGP